ncbi:MAG TPA: septum formation family protein [Propioniciclava sp.]|jgi:hypothetical protein|uniref:septum formation family protein n=1 Tax=Propioniciclava sp. TaxID=2038686 RepID=UPI002CDCBE77|nr:septum formation family protein [Propioniciclava sp.]HRL47756.1 septum formation family protein [Propioniciclava sp.]HRL79989.1 septum formation family protein [Propioniciclava sp.]
MITVRTAGLALAAALLLSGCSANDALQRVEQVKQEAGKAMLPTIALGECTNLEIPETESGSQVSSIPKTDCAQPHGWEAYAEKEYPLDASYPGETAVQDEAGDFCSGEFETFLGVDYDSSEMELQYLYPTQDTWTSLNDRTLTCLVGSSSNDVVGSLKGTQR